MRDKQASAIEASSVTADASVQQPPTEGEGGVTRKNSSWGAAAAAVKTKPMLAKGSSRSRLVSRLAIKAVAAVVPRNDDTFPRYELILLLFLFNGLSESAAKALAGELNPEDQDTALKNTTSLVGNATYDGEENSEVAVFSLTQAIISSCVLAVLCIVCGRFAFHILRHIRWNKSIAWSGMTMSWHNTRGAQGKVEEWGPLFEGLRPTNLRYLHFVCVALPLQLMRALLIGLLYGDTDREALQAWLLLILFAVDMVVVLVWWPSLDRRADASASRGLQRQHCGTCRRAFSLGRF